MSTKIYDGFRFVPFDLNEIHTLLMAYRLEVRDAVYAAEGWFLARKAAALVLAHHPHRTPVHTFGENGAVRLVVAPSPRKGEPAGNTGGSALSSARRSTDVGTRQAISTSQKRQASSQVPGAGH